MNHTNISKILLVLFAVVLCFGPVGLAGPLGTAFTYQGRLIDNNKTADGLYDFQFKLFDANSGGNKLGQDVNNSEVDVIDGYFTAELDFGGVFDGNNRWLDIGIRPGELEDPCVYTLLTPRQKVTPTPYALYAKTAGSGGAGGDSLWQVNGTSIYYNNGNVGIGTTGPAAKLEVNGDISTASNYKIGGSTVLSAPGTQNTLVGLAAGAVNTGSGNTFTGYQAGNHNTSGSNNMFSGGQAGIGNTTGYQNTFLGTTAGYFNTTGNHNTFSGCQAGSYNHTGNYNVFIGSQAGFYETGSNKLYIANDLADSNVLIYGDFSTGRIGLGTKTLDAKLNVYSSDSNTISATSSQSTGRAVYGKNNSSGNYGYLGSSSYGVYGTNSTSNNYGYLGGGLCGVYGSSTSSSGYGVYGSSTSSGSYGYGVYGTTTTSSGSGVYGTTTGSSGYGVYGYATGANGIGVYGRAPNDNGIGVLGRSSSGVYGYLGGGSYGAYGSCGLIYGYLGGNSQGVHGESPSTVNGVGVYGYGGAYDFYAAGPGDNYGSASSIRWKRDIQPIDEPLEKIMQLRGVYFNWDAEHGGHHDVGMVAEEVGKVLPEIVGYEENGIDATGMDYGKLAPLLVEAVKALKTEVDDLRKENQDLHSRLDALEKLAKGAK
jgi:hypothetical protein